jgi:hypothetical protein
MTFVPSTISGEMKWPITPVIASAEAGIAISRESI